MKWYGGFAPYVRVADRKKKAEKEVKKLKKKGDTCEPIRVEGRTIVDTFWGKAWCSHLEAYSDYSNRLPRGRTYVRNGSVIDLKISAGEINALVSGSSIYKVKIAIKKVVKNQWAKIVDECAGKIDSLIELLQGKFSNAVMKIMTAPKKGLFPDPKEIELSCSCPDWAVMCKHVAAVLYGIGTRLDKKPEELFILRQADHFDLITKAGTTSFTQTTSHPDDRLLADSDLSSLFGIDMDHSSPQKKAATKKKSLPKKRSKKTSRVKKTRVKATRAKATPKQKIKVAKKILKKTSQPKRKTKVAKKTLKKSAITRQ